MDTAINADQLLQSVGSPVHSMTGEYIGDILEVTRDKDGNNIEYLVLCGNTLPGSGTRYFAIPASSSWIDTSPEGAITLKTTKDDLSLAKGVRADKCPKPTFEFGASIYELYQYEKKRKVPNTANPIS